MYNVVVHATNEKGDFNYMHFTYTKIIFLIYLIIVEKTIYLR